MKIFLVWKSDTSGDGNHDLLCGYKTLRSAYRRILKLASVDLVEYKNVIWENERSYPGLYGPDIQQKMDNLTVKRWARHHWFIEETELL